MAYAYDIDPNLSMDEIVQQLSLKLPCDWLDEIRDPAQPHEFIDKYVTDEMMAALGTVREQLDDPVMQDQALALINSVTSEIYDLPRTKSEFMVLRGVYGRQDWEKGDILRLNTPKSGSFSFNDAYGNYVDQDSLYETKACCGAEIIIPAGMPLAYHPSEDQVVFPSGAELTVLEPIRQKEYKKGKYWDADMGTYKLLYSNAPKKPMLYDSFNQIPTTIQKISD